MGRPIPTHHTPRLTQAKAGGWTGPAPWHAAWLASMLKKYKEAISREQSRRKRLGLGILWFVERGATRLQARQVLLQYEPLMPQGLAAQRVQGGAHDEAQVHGATATTSLLAHVPAHLLTYLLTCPPTY